MRGEGGGGEAYRVKHFKFNVSYVIHVYTNDIIPSRIGPLDEQDSVRVITLVSNV